MKITQLAAVLNGTNKIIEQVTGKAAGVATEDLSNIVDIGKDVLDFTGVGNENFDSYVRGLIDQIGKIMFVDRTYVSQAPNILKDGWEYGSILQKVRCEVTDPRDNATWDLFNYTDGEIADGGSYPDPFVLSRPSVSAKFFNSKATYEIPITLTDIQLREAFRSAAEFGKFVAMIENRIRVKMTLINDALIMATIDNLIGKRLNGADPNSAVNLAQAYYDATGIDVTDDGNGGTLPLDYALTNKEFLRFASKVIAQYKKYLATAGTMYNDGNYVTFTPADRLHFVANTEFARALDAYLYSDTYHNEFVNLPGYEEVAFWQANQEKLAIDIKVDVNGTATSVANDYVLAVMFDDEAAAVCNQNFRVTSAYNGRGEYTNYFYKWDALYMNDTDENAVVFYLGTVTP